MKTKIVCAGLLMSGVCWGVTYPVVDTGQVRAYDDQREISYPSSRDPYFGQDANYLGLQPSYRDNSDGTVSDLNTGLMWQADPGPKRTYAEAVSEAGRCRTGGYGDWRLPTIKELYSLIDFGGEDPDPRASSASRPFIDTNFFNFQYGNTEKGERIIDSQWATSTLYQGTVMNGARAMFGVNFADGRIKGYPADAMRGRGAKTYYVIYVRGNQAYGKNDFVDNGDGTITDRATGLTWMQRDSVEAMDWPSALEYAENINFAGHDDWRLPNAKELQSIVDYSRAPDVSQSAAIDPVFHSTPISNEAGQTDYGHYWSSTTHATFRGGRRAVYVAFGRALGNMNGQWMDVHGAGAQRSDMKTGNEQEMPQGQGPQGDAQRINNRVRLVRGGVAEITTSGPVIERRPMQRMERPEPQERQREERQGQRPPHRGAEDFIRGLDRNGDGRVSIDEFDGPREHFSHFDRDRDGFLSPEEAPPPRREIPPFSLKQR